MKNYIINTFVVISSLIATIFLVVCFLVLIDKPKNKGVVAGWRYPGKDKHVNQLGFKGRRIDYSNDSIVILLLGDSQVEAKNLPFGCFPEQALEYHLSFFNPQVKVFSLGATGYGNDQQLLVLKEYFQKYRADYVLLWQTISNDIWNNIFPTHCPKDGWPKPTFWLENGVLKGPNYLMGEKLPCLTLKLRGPQSGMDEEWEKKLPEAYKPMGTYSGNFFSDCDWKKNKKNPYLRYDNLYNEKSNNAIYLYPRSPRMQYGLDLTKKLLYGNR